MRTVTTTLILANVAMFALKLAVPSITAPLALWPPTASGPGNFAVWQLLTYAFLHHDGMHLGLNMFALWLFGRDCELALGGRRYLMLFLVAVLSGALTEIAYSLATHVPEPMIGASGGVFGVLLAFGMMFPQRRILLLFPPVPMPAWLFVTLYGVIELVNGVFGTQAGVAHFAHLGGMLGAWLAMRHWRRATARR